MSASTMMLRFLFISLVCLLGVASAARGRVGANGRGGWARKPLAVGALGGTEPGLEPYLLEFHGANCDHCEAMEPLMLKLRRLFRIKIRTYMVWEGTAAFRYMTVLDEEFQCKGLPFFYNRRSRQAICGATTWPNFRDWALNKKCETFLPPLPTPEEEYYNKRRELQKVPLLERLKARAQGSQKASPAQVEEYDE